MNNLGINYDKIKSKVLGKARRFGFDFDPNYLMNEEIKEICIITQESFLEGTRRWEELSGQFAVFASYH